jgi:hypothetical protein
MHINDNINGKIKYIVNTYTMGTALIVFVNFFYLYFIVK